VSTSAAAVRARPARPVRSPRHPAGIRRTAAALRVVDTEAQRRARRVRRVLAGFCVTIVCSLVAAVGFHVVVAQGQLQLDRLEAEVAAEQDRYQDLRVLVAGLSSPERITTRAQELGMVPPGAPPGVVSVPGDPAAPVPAPSDSTGTTLAESWPKVKPHLDSR
jgi:cell division protein FtsL